MYVWCSVARPPGGWSCFFLNSSDQPPDCPFTRYLHHFGTPRPVYFILHHMYFTYCIIIFILYTLTYFVLYTIYYILYMYLVPPTPPQATHRRGNTDTSTGGGDPYHGGASNTEHGTIYTHKLHQAI